MIPARPAPATMNRVRRVVWREWPFAVAVLSFILAFDAAAREPAAFFSWQHVLKWTLMIIGCEFYYLHRVRRDDRKEQP